MFGAIELGIPYVAFELSVSDWNLATPFIVKIAINSLETQFIKPYIEKNTVWYQSLLPLNPPTRPLANTSTPPSAKPNTTTKVLYQKKNLSPPSNPPVSKRRGSSESTTTHPPK